MRAVDEAYRNGGVPRNPVFLMPVPEKELLDLPEFIHVQERVPTPGAEALHDGGPQQELARPRPRSKG